MLSFAILLLLQEKPVDYATTRDALAKVQLVVGEWRCTGQPKELKREPWTEKAAWTFKIEKDLYRLQLTTTGGIFWKDAMLGYDVEKKVFTLDATLADGAARAYRGTLKEKDREMTLEQVTDAWPRERVVFSLLRDNRFLITFEAQAAKGKEWAQQAILGCTKEGVPFAKASGPLCVVTGGTGTISVSHKGKTYYVC